MSLSSIMLLYDRPRVKIVRAVHDTWRLKGHALDHEFRFVFDIVPIVVRYYLCLNLVAIIAVFFVTMGKAWGMIDGT